MNILQVCGVSLSLLLFLLQMGKQGAPSGRMIVFAASLLLFFASLTGIGQMLGLMRGQLHTGGAYEALYKALGIGLISQFTAELCRDAAEPVLANRIEFFAKAEIILLSVPLLQQIFSLAAEFAA